MLAILSSYISILLAACILQFGTSLVQASQKSELRETLERELKDVSPEVHETLANSIEHSKVDRTKYRDIFLIKKHVQDDETHRVVTYNIQESLIPRYVSSIFPPDIALKTCLIVMLVLLTLLVLTTSLRLYQSFIYEHIKPTKCDCIV